MAQLRTMVAAAVIGLSGLSVMAQGGAGMGPGGGQGPMGAGPGASAAGMGMGMGPGGGRGAGRAGARFTSGWALMSPQERSEHRDRMRSMTGYDECKVYRDQHHDKMAARAMERGATPLPAPRRDACSALKS